MASAKSRKNVKKKFFEVEAPLTAVRIHLYGAEPAEFDGRIVRIDLTKSLRGKGVDYKLRIRANGEELSAEPLSLEMFGSFVRRMIRKGTDYVEDSFVAEAKDGQVIVKPFFITRNKVSRAVRKAIRESAKKYLEGYLKTRDIREIFKEIMSNKIQKDLSLKIKKIYPLAMSEIRVLSVIEGKKKEVKEEKKLD